MTREELLSKFDELLRTHHEYDLDGAVSHYAEDAIVEFHTGQRCIGRAAIREHMKPLLTKQRGEVHFDVLHLDVDVSRDVVWSSFILTLTKDGVETSMRGAEMLVFKNRLVSHISLFVQSEKPLTVTRSQSAA